MKLFGPADDEGPGPAQTEAQRAALEKLDTALTSIFSEEGKRTVLYYLTNRYNLSLDEAIADPSKLERALTGLLGEVGWMVVKKAILEEFWQRKISVNETALITRTSLRGAFGSVLHFGPGISMFGA